LIQGDDHLGALAEIQRNLLDAGVKIYACNELLDGISLLPLICVSFQSFVGFTFDFLPPKRARHQVGGKRIQNVMEVIAFLMREPLFLTRNTHRRRYHSLPARHERIALAFTHHCHLWRSLCTLLVFRFFQEE